MYDVQAWWMNGCDELMVSDEWIDEFNGWIWCMDVMNGWME